MSTMFDSGSGAFAHLLAPRNLQFDAINEHLYRQMHLEGGAPAHSYACTYNMDVIARAHTLTDTYSPVSPASM